MEQPVRNDGTPATTPGSTTTPGKLSPYLLSRDYEDYLDWLENQRRTRTRSRRGGGRFIFGALTAFATAFSFAGTLMRRR